MKLPSQRWLFQAKYPAYLRRGFTLVEILIVMVIVLILSGILLTAVVMVINRVKLARQSAEIEQLSMALNKFKEKYGIYPPSRIRLREYDSLTNPNSPQYTPYNLSDPFDAHSLSYLKRIWPNIKLPTVQAQNGPLIETPDPGTRIRWFVDNATGAAWNPNNNYYELEGDECLVFFLGGVVERTGATTYILHGFTDDPRNPSRIPDTADPRTITRVAEFPLYDFKPDRLYQRDTALNQVAPAGTAENVLNGILDFFPQGNTANRPIKLPSYRALTSDASQPMPIAYFSAYEGRGYRPDDCNIPPLLGLDPQILAEQTIYFQIRWPQITWPPNTQQPQSPESLGPNPYTQGALAAAVNTQTNSLTFVQPYKPNEFQIIVPGADNEFGGGGNQADYTSTGQQWGYNDDNLTSFSGGQAISDFLASQKKGN